MQAYRRETTLAQDHKLMLEDLPFQAGESVEVIILTRSRTCTQKNSYSLRGTPIRYLDPTEPVAQEEWEVLP